MTVITYLQREANCGQGIGRRDRWEEAYAAPLWRSASACCIAGSPMRWQKSPKPSPATRDEENSSKSGSSVSAIASNGTLSANWRVEPRAGEVAADIQAVETGHAADNADIPGVRPRAAVRAAGDADAEPLALEPITAQPCLDRQLRCRRAPARPRSAPSRSSANPGRRAPSVRPVRCPRRGARRVRAAGLRSRRDPAGGSRSG